MLKPFFATAAASLDEIQTLGYPIQRWNYVECGACGLHDNGVVGQSNVVGQDHLLPNNGGLSSTFQRAVFGLGERIQGLFDGFSRSRQSLLSRGVFLITVCVEFIATGTEIISGEHLGCVHQQIGRELDGFRRGKTELPSRGLVSIRCPRSGFGARNVLGEGLGDNRSVAGSIDLSDDVDATLEVKEVNNTEQKSKRVLWGGENLLTSLAYFTISSI